MEVKSSITGSMTFSHHKVHFREQTEELPANKSLHTIIAHMQGRKPHILIRNREFINENEAQGRRQ
jgi:hypothetical protein